MKFRSFPDFSIYDSVNHGVFHPIRNVCSKKSMRGETLRRLDATNGPAQQHDLGCLCWLSRFVPGTHAFFCSFLSVTLKISTMQDSLCPGHFSAPFHAMALLKLESASKWAAVGKWCWSCLTDHFTTSIPWLIINFSIDKSTTFKPKYHILAEISSSNRHFFQLNPHV